jgi:hypothetical protein
MYTEQEQTEIVALFSRLGSIYGKDTDAIDMYMAAFFVAELSVDDISKGIQGHLLDTKAGAFYPKPSDILRNVRGSIEDEAIEAWVAVLDAVKRSDVTSFGPVVFDNPKINWTVNRMGGIGIIKTGSAEQKDLYQKKFCKFYRVAKDDLQCNPSHNIHSPVLIGNLEKCAKLLAGEVKGRIESKPNGFDLSSLADSKSV